MQKSKILGWLGLIALGAVILTACASTAQPTEPASGGDSAAGLADTSWKLTEIDGKVVPGDVGATIAFTGDQVTGSGGCNGFGGGYMVEGSTITFSEVASTLMACEGPKMDVETSYLGALQGKATFTLSGGALVITGSGGTKLTFAPQ
jgi:heat shock protein HslJ